jgi:hypothetical protein
MTTRRTPGRTLDARDIATIQRPAMDYAQGWYEGDAERMERALCPEMIKRAYLLDGHSNLEPGNCIAPDRQ